MSYNITGTTITLTRGDTFEALVSATKRDGTQYIPVEGDVIRFAMKENYDDPRPLLVKDIPIDTMMLTLEPQDTADLNFGKYVYDIQLTKANGIEKIKVNGTEVTPAAEDKSIALTIPTGKLAGKDIVAETDLDAALKEKVNAAAEGNHSHANKAFLDTLSGATDEEVTAMCTEVFGA